MQIQKRAGGGGGFGTGIFDKVPKKPRTRTVTLILKGGVFKKSKMIEREVPFDSMLNSGDTVRKQEPGDKILSNKKDK